MQNAAIPDCSPAGRQGLKTDYTDILIENNLCNLLLICVIKRWCYPSRTPCWVVQQTPCWVVCNSA
ncbi:MAG: hypothetical protein KJ569_06585 [Candidatus Omnitrophica bacterium]|nr:hypothetical protein [Candidatus Omnitrophota bacterium]MBU1134561.1 hypothetical protein [Candidatus Omnitrophota bacterium]MBU1523516.1 hypothetical protein [Candidatus Omnitrophota bacterium]